MYSAKVLIKQSNRAAGAATLSARDALYFYYSSKYRIIILTIDKLLNFHVGNLPQLRCVLRIPRTLSYLRPQHPSTPNGNGLTQYKFNGKRLEIGLPAMRRDK